MASKKIPPNIKDEVQQIITRFNQEVLQGREYYYSLEIYLSELLDIKVDLVMKDGLKPHIGKNILAEVVAV